MATRNRAFNRKGLELTHPNAAGIDIGSASHYVAVPADRDDEPVREFASFTADLHRLAVSANQPASLLRERSRARPSAAAGRRSAASTAAA